MLMEAISQETAWTTKGVVSFSPKNLVQRRVWLDTWPQSMSVAPELPLPST